MEIQKRFHGTYVTVGKTTVHSDGVHFRRRLKLKHGGTFRALVTPSGEYVPNNSGTEHVKVRRR